jgi:hypothetical protein
VGVLKVGWRVIRRVLGLLGLDSPVFYLNDKKVPQAEGQIVR